MAPVQVAKGAKVMLQFRIHGCGGHGVVAAAEKLSIATFERGRYAQGFPSVGSERTGARAYIATATATASQSLLFMAEAVYNASGWGCRS